MLCDPARHEPLCDTPWDPLRAHAGMQDIVRDIERSRLSQGHWPVHPLDDEGDTPAGGFKSLYLGSAGLGWALWHLQQAGAVQLQERRTDPVAVLRAAHAAYLAEPDTGEVVPSFFLGEVGIALALWRATGDAAVAERLHAQVQANIGHPALEPLWAAPGTMLAAWHLWHLSGEARWRSLFLQNVDVLWERWDTRVGTDDEPACWIWTQELDGHAARYMGAAHGFAGNAHPMLKGAALLAPERRATLYQRCADTLAATALQGQDGLLNWPPQAPASKPDPSGKWLMQWCHGAPGIITAMADFPVGQDVRLDAMLLAAGEAVWAAGPLAKGPGLCHGTAGNGQAFLVLHQRSGDALWLDRARRFAVHALAQCEQQRQAHGMGRYNLWTGDAGVASYLWQCLQARPGMPTLDFI